jgi:23S rRNA pseudouridine2605 synthase
LGLGSRKQAEQWVREGRVQVNERRVSDPEFPVRPPDRVTVAGRESPPERLVLMLNKPRGLVTTVRDEHGRDTVYSCFEGASLPWVAPIGRLDKASEGLLLFSNDPQWAARVTDPEAGPAKTYHVQIDRLPDAELLEKVRRGVRVDGELLRVREVRPLRAGRKHAWLEIVLSEGRNRQIRRLLAACDTGVLRLIRVAVGALPLGRLGKGRWRVLTAAEMAALFATAEAPGVTAEEPCAPAEAPRAPAKGLPTPADG